MILHLLAYFILVMQDLPAHSTGKTCIAYRLTNMIILSEESTYASKI